MLRHCDVANESLTSLMILFLQRQCFVEHGATDASKSTHGARLRTIDISLLPHQIARGLRDGAALVRVAFAARTDYTPDSCQIKAGLEDPDPSVRRAFVVRPDVSFTETQLDRLVIDSDKRVRLALAKRGDIKLTDDQMADLLDDPDIAIRIAIISRKDFIPVEAQVQRGIQTARTDEEHEAWREALARAAAATNGDSGRSKKTRRL